ncbi:DUF397 domain-containing protein [Nocardia ninae]|uniref:DUF397 domain-containing protein n=1 Tax=Nocardia ninae NBRC 108245 TaxID=1210091 RepID=A0A511MMR7_9NOCA|nr:DUF397 domain-containing protein [Nocardia ninae]GEM41914.1 DUF397 domain-containing protein [Nocardia ninae NBRC 108245]
MRTDLSTASWFKSSYSSPSQDCVEVAFLGGDGVGVRDSKNPNGAALVFSSSEWEVFIAGVASGGFELR